MFEVLREAANTAIRKIAGMPALFYQRTSKSPPGWDNVTLAREAMLNEVTRIKASISSLYDEKKRLSKEIDALYPVKAKKRRALVRIDEMTKEAMRSKQHLLKALESARLRTRSEYVEVKLKISELEECMANTIQKNINALKSQKRQILEVVNSPAALSRSAHTVAVARLQKQTVH